jgi:D-alanyl-D-alanine carboxypeptidase/D-alanyl-D-alanine-endopeptidase (penicillin-binding protein 4)
MKRAIYLLIAAFSIGPWALGQGETLESLRARITAHISQQKFAASRWGIKVISLDTGRTLFEHRADEHFNPASNAKLYTAALALDRLGPDFRIKTSLYATARPDPDGTLKGDLIVYGRGDPTIGARWNGGDYYKGLERLVEAVASAGVRRIEGDLIGDESYFRGPPLGSGWEWDDLQWHYGAEVSALSINDNAVDLFVVPAERAGIPCRVTTGPATSFITIINRTLTAPKGSERKIAIYRPLGQNVIYVSGQLPLGDPGYRGYVAVHDPAGFFAWIFREALARRGIAVAGRPKTIDWKYREVAPIDFSKLIEIRTIESPPLKDIIREMLKQSQNLYAQLLLLQVGAQSGEGASDQTTEEAGIEQMRSFLARMGIKAGEVLLEEGSGLSRRSVVTPSATATLLYQMRNHRWADVFFEALPIAGLDGTLQNRMRGGLAARNVRAKTGTLRYVNALSGYLTTAAGERLAFSIILNSYEEGAFSPRDEIDNLVEMLAEFYGSSK